MGNTDLREIGERISRRRKHMGLTQEQLAEKMDVSIQMISNLERGVKAIRIDNLVKLSQILNVSTDYILTGQKPSGDIDTLSKQISQLSSEKQGLIEVIISYCLQNDK